MARATVTVIGAGVSGLSTALCLLERGAAVRVLARARTPGTTSAVAAAFWHPFRCEEGKRSLDWAGQTWRRFAELAQSEVDCGVRLQAGDELFSAPVPDPWWRSVVVGFDRLLPEQLPPGRADGWRFTAPIIETPIYLRWLERRVLALGGHIESATPRDLDEVGKCARDADVLVICVGLGARELLGDQEMFACRGQLAWLEPVRIERFVLDLGDPAAVTYVIPRADAIVCGGTAEDGVETDEAEPEVAAAIVARARALVPALAHARVLRIGAGLRPCRSRVRLERGGMPDGRPVVYNYGHGGAGYSLSWGCAAEAAALALSG